MTNMTQTSNEASLDGLNTLGFNILAIEDSAPNRVTLCDGVDEATSWLGRTGTRIAVIYRPPVHAIAPALGGGIHVDEALARWKQVCSALLNVHRSHRMRMSFVEAKNKNAPSPKTKAALAEALNGADWPRMQHWPARARPFEPLAALLLNQEPATRALIDQLQAATRGGFMDLPGSTLALETVVAAFRDQLSADAPGPGHGAAGTTAAPTSALPVLKDQVTSLQSVLSKANTIREANLRKLADESHVSDMILRQIMDLEKALIQLSHDNKVLANTSTFTRMIRPARALVARLRR